MKDEVIIKYPHIHDYNNESRIRVHCNFLQTELSKFKKINIPTQKDYIDGEELASWLIEECSPEEIEKLVYTIRLARKRNSNTKPIFQTAAVSLLTKLYR